MNTLPDKSMSNPYLWPVWARLLQALDADKRNRLTERQTFIRTFHRQYADAITVDEALTYPLP